MACISVDSLPLQILHRSLTADVPLIVIESDRPGARIECLSSAALERGVSIGMRYSEALSLCADLRAGVIGAAERRAAVAEISEVIARYSPAVEAVPGSPGAFWVATAGLEQLFGADAQWATLVCTDLLACGFTAVVVHGWTRLGTFVAALQRQTGNAGGNATGSTGGHGAGNGAGNVEKKSAPSPLEERRWAYRQPLSLLPLSPRDRRQIIDHLGLKTIASLARIPPHQLKSRFSRETVALHRFITRAEQLPIQAYHTQEPIRYEQYFDSALRRTAQLAEVCLALLQRCSALLKEQGQWITAVCIQLRDEDGRQYFERVRIAQPTRNIGMLERLLRLRLDGFRGSAVTHVALELETVAGTHEQTSLGLDAAEAGATTVAAPLNKALLGEAVALLQAEFGAAAVLMAELVPHHLLERQVRWRECTPEDCAGVIEDGQSGEGRRSGDVGQSRGRAPDSVGESTGGVAQLRLSGAALALVRRVLSEPREVATTKMVRSWGPFLISGEWWNATGIERCAAVWLHREGNFCWVARARGSRRWILYAYA